MRVHDSFIPDDLFTEFIAQMPEVCVEIVVENGGDVLLVKRANKPAKGEWFWPGGRLFKGEQLTDCAHRIAAEELSIGIEIKDRIGVYTHFWETSAEQNNPSRHTVNIVYHARPIDDSPTISLDEQHSDTRWITEIEDGHHEYVKTYLEDSNFV